MNYLLLILALALPTAAGAASDVYLKLDDIDGETTSARETETTSVMPIRAEITTTDADAVTPPDAPQEGRTDALLEIGGVEGESTKGKVEFEWKVEEGEKSPEAPGATDIAAGAQPLTPDFSILLGGGSDDDENAREGRAVAAEMLMRGMQEAGAPVEQVALNYEKITTKLRQDVKLFGFIPVQAAVEVDVDAEQRVTVRFPWWAFLASGKDAGLGERVFTTLSNVLKAKHDTLKNAIQNVR